MRVTIVRPPVLMPLFNMADLVVPPIGPAYIASSLRRQGNEVAFIDAVGSRIDQYTQHERGLLHGLTPEQIVERIPGDTDCIGVSVMFSYEWPVCRDLLRRIRSRFPRATLFAGGEHITSVPELCLEETSLDAAVLGEGEQVACDLIEAIERDGLSGMERVAGVCFRAPDGRSARSRAAARMRELEKIPWPAWDLVPLEEYLSRGCGFGVNRGRSVPVLASRGCPYQCTFCSNPLMWTTRWVARDPHELLDELAFLQKTYGATNFDFYDLTVIVKRKWIIDFCEAILARKMNFTWQLPSGTRSEVIDEEVSRLLYETGCKNISYAPESASEETLTAIKKKISFPKMLRSMRGAVKNGLNVKANFIFGFPNEGWKNILETLWGMLRTAVVGIHDISIWIFVPYPGSELFDQLQASGRIRKLDDEYFYRLASYADISLAYSYCDRLSERALLWARAFGLALFYAASWLIRPWRLLQMVSHAARGRLESRSEATLLGLFKRLGKWFSPSKPRGAPRAVLPAPSPTTR